MGDAHAPAGRAVVWVRGPHMTANGMLLARRRLLTSRQALFTYPDAENTEVQAVSGDGRGIVSATCLPSQCLLMNQAVEFAIVSVPGDFGALADVQPVRLPPGPGPTVRAGDSVAIVTNTGASASCGCVRAHTRRRRNGVGSQRSCPRKHGTRRSCGPQ